MTIRTYTTRHGKVIQTLSLDDLDDVVTSGTRLRAPCPIHGSDHQRSLSIDAASGWGYCHCCHATVLVQPMGSERMREARAGISPVAGKNRHHDCPSAGRRYSYSHVLPPSTSVPVQPRWQQEERAALTALAPLLRTSLMASQRAQAYLDERGIPIALAQASGMGYLSRFAWEQAAATTAKERGTLLTRWIGRLLFPLHAPDGCGYIGRTLMHWQPGMDENTHKTVLDQPGMPRRWIKTSPAGWFGFAEPSSLCDHLILVEGGFDRLALLAAGLPASLVVALVGTAARPAWFVQHAPQVKSVVLALDADAGGTAAMERLSQEFEQAGIAAICCPPSQDRWGKDWNERWRRLGPQSVWPLYEALAQCTSCSPCSTLRSAPHPSEKGGNYG